MREHVRIVGILNIVMGCLVALIGIVILVVMGGIAGFLSTSASSGENNAAAAPIVAAIGLGVAIFFLVLALPGIIGGWGLLNFRPWARILIIVVSVLHLLHIPFGTALGVYGLWTLLNDETRRLFQTGGQIYVPAPAQYPAVATGPQQPTYPPPPPPAV